MTGVELYHEAQRLILSMPADAEEDDEERWSDDLEAWADATGHKIEAYRAVHQAATDRASRFKSQAEAYTVAAGRELRTAAQMEVMATTVLRGAEDLSGAPEVLCEDGTKVKLRRRKSPKVEVVDESVVPIHLFVTNTATRVDKREALKALKAGDDIPGLELTHSISEKVAWGL